MSVRPAKKIQEKKIKQILVAVAAEPVQKGRADLEN